MRSNIQKWGNSLGLRLPKALAQAAHLREGSTVEIIADGNTIVIRSLDENEWQLANLLEQYPTKKTRRGETDWGKSEDDEAW